MKRLIFIFALLFVLFSCKQENNTENGTLYTNQGTFENVKIIKYKRNGVVFETENNEVITLKGDYILKDKNTVGQGILYTDQGTFENVKIVKCKRDSVVFETEDNEVITVKGNYILKDKNNTIKQNVFNSLDIVEKIDLIIVSMFFIFMCIGFVFCILNGS